LGQLGTASARKAQNASNVAGLARFFPDAMPMRLPVQFARTVTAGGASGSDCAESTIIEFGTPREAIFSCHMPLEFADVLRLKNSDGSLDVEAAVVAVQYHPGETIVAARFVGEVPNWIVKP
jgi:hypothetical protein